MTKGIITEIKTLSLTKGIDADIVLAAVKDAMLVAARKYYKSTEDLIAEINDTSGSIDVFAIKLVTDLVADPSMEVSVAQARKVKPSANIGDTVRFELSTQPLGRISAQMAKQVIFQKVREAERETICREFEDRINNMETCTVKRIEAQDLIVELGHTEARIPKREQSRLETYMPGDRVRVIIKGIEKAGRGPAVIVSRASEELVKRLFEQEVPEIYDKTVEIKSCSREAGERTKIAVLSHDRDVDAVGACVGMKGMRVQTIIRELRGEKIDIIEYIPEPLEMVRSALNPAKVTRVNILDSIERHLEVIVDESQLSLAIGKKGQNVRLAAKLLGWRIDIKSEDEKNKEVQDAIEAMSGGGTPVSFLTNFGLSEGLIDHLIGAKTATVESLADMTPEQLMMIPGIGPELIERIQSAVNQCYTHFERAVGVVPVDTRAIPTPGDSPENTPRPTEKKSALPTVLPGAPEHGKTEEGEDEVIDFDEVELERFGKINRFTDIGQEQEQLANTGEQQQTAEV